MNLASILITLVAKDEASPDIAKVIASLLGLGGASATSSVQVLAAYAGITGGTLVMVAAVAAAAYALKKSYEVMIGAMEAVGHAIRVSIEDAMAWQEAFAEVRKVVGDGNPGLKILETQLLDLATKVPVATGELAKLAAVGAQMGIPTTHLQEFTEVAARLAATVDGISAEKMAIALGRLAGLTQSTTNQMKMLSSAVVKLSADTVANTDEIMRGALGFAGIGHQVGLSNAQIIAFSATMGSLDRRIERSSTAMYSMLRTFSLAADEGGKKAAVFARVLGMTTEEFMKAARANPSKVFEDFVTQLGHSKKAGDDVNRVLRDLGFTGTKTGGIFVALSNNSKALKENLASANEEVLTGNALITQSNTRWDTFTKTLALLHNEVNVASIEFGKTFLPALNILGKALMPVGDELIRQARIFHDVYGGSITEAARALAGYVTGLKDAIKFLSDTATGSGILSVATKSLSNDWREFARILDLFTSAKPMSAVEESLLRAIPLVGQLAADFRKMRAEEEAWRNRVKAGSGTGHRAPGDEAPPDDKGQTGDTPEEVALKAAIKLQEKYREEIDKLRDVHRNTYETMAADIQRATDKRILDAKLIKDISETTLKGLLAQIQAIDKGEREAAVSSAFLKEMGPPLGEAADKWEKLAGVLQMAAKQGLQPTREQLVHAEGDLKAFRNMSDMTFTLLESKSPGAYARLKEFFDKVAEGAKMTAEDWQSAFDQISKETDDNAGRVQHWAGSTLAAFATLTGIEKSYTGTNGMLGNQRLAIAREEIFEMANKLTWQEKNNKELINEIVLLHDKKLISDAVFTKLMSGLEGTTKSTQNWERALRGVLEAFSALGIKADSVFGRMLATFNAVAQAYKAMPRDSAGNVIPYKNQTSGQRTDSIAQAAVLATTTIVNIYNGSRNNDNTASRTFGGAMQGGAAGAEIGYMFGGPAGAAAGAVIGAFAGAAIAFFSGPPWHNAAKMAGSVFGMHVSDELSKAIYADSQKLGISLKSATLLHLTEGIKESGKAVSEFQHQIGELMTGVADGSIPAAKGIDQIGQAFEAAKTEASKSGDMIDQTMLGMIVNARALGLEVASISAHIKENLTKAIEGVNKLFVHRPDSEGKTQDKGPLLLNVNTQKDAEAMAAIFNATFWGAVKEFGLIGAIDALKVPFDNLMEQLTAAGYDTAALFGDTLAFFGYAANEEFKGAAESITGLKEGLVGLANAGMLTQDAFHAFGHAAKMAYDQAFEASGDSRASIMATLPLLAELKKAHDLYGYQLSEEEQKLMDQAEAAGVAFPVDPVLQVRDAIYELIEAITGIPRKVDIDINTHHNNTNNTPPGEYGYNEDGTPDNDGDKSNSFAFGGYVPYQAGGKVVRVAERTGEFMVPDDMMAKLVGTGGGQPIHVHVHYPNGMIEEIVTQGSKNGSVRVFPDAVRKF